MGRITSTPAQSMSANLAPCYLPLTLKAAQAFLTRGEVPSLTVERAGLFAMLMIAKSESISSIKLEQLMGETEARLAELPMDEVASWLSELAAGQGIAAMSEAIADFLEDRGVHFCPEFAMEERAWCGPDGRYTHAFQNRCRNMLVDCELSIGHSIDDESEEGAEQAGYEDDDAEVMSVRRSVKLHCTTDQARAASIIAAAPDEHVAVNAYAGVGKTHLILALSDLGGRYTYLATTAAQRFAFAQRAGTATIRITTLGELATEMAAAHARRQHGTRYVRPPSIGDADANPTEQVSIGDIQPIGKASAQQVLAEVLAGIGRWCYSADREIGSEHFSRLLSFTVAEQRLFVATAQHVWDLMCRQTKQQERHVFGFYPHHRVKWLEVSGANIPLCGTLLVDEAHDLSPAWYEMLSRYPGGWIALGDPYQRLYGKAPQTPRAKALTMIQSVRTGERAMPLIRATLDLHGERLLSEPLIGSRNHITRYRPYSVGTELPEGGLRVYGSVWTMMKDALRLKDAGARFRFIPASYVELKMMATDAIELAQGRGVPKHAGLRKFREWEELANHLRSVQQRPIARLFERGFKSQNLDALLDAEAPQGEEGLTLGLLAHCKNLEFSTVTMSWCCFQGVAKDGPDTLVRALYVAMTRVRDELWLPGDALDRLADEIRAVAPAI